MAKLNGRKILAEEFKDQPWIAKLLGPLNEFITQVTQGINGGLTIQDNLR